MKHLIGKKVIIHPNNDNESYSDYKDKVLVITHADNKGIGYDSSLYPEMLCDFKCDDGTQFPFALYEYEFSIIK